MRRALVIAAALAALLVGAASASAATRRPARRLAAGLRDAQPVQGRSRRSTSSRRRRCIYDQLIGAQAERPEHRLQPHGAGDGRRRLGRRQDDHVPPAHGIHWSDGKPFTSADALWTFNAVLKNKTNQLHGTIEARQVGRRRPTRTRSSCTSRRATRSSSRSSRSRSCPSTSGRRTRSRSSTRSTGPIPTVTTAPYDAHEVGEARHDDPDAATTKYDSFRNGGKLPDVKRILITYYANPDSIYRDVDQGNLDYGYGGPPAWARRAKTDNNANVHLVRAARRLLGDRVQLLPADGLADLQRPGQGRQDEVVQDPAIRKALAYAIDREKLIPTVYDGQGVTAYGLISPRFKRYYASERTRRSATPTTRPRRSELKDGRLELLADAVHQERREGRVRARHALQHTVPGDGPGASRPTREGRHRHRPQLHVRRRAQQPHLRERQDEGSVRAQLRRLPVGLGRRAARRPRRSWRCCSRTTPRATRSTTARRSTRR